MISILSPACVPYHQPEPRRSPHHMGLQVRSLNLETTKPYSINQQRSYLLNVRYPTSLNPITTASSSAGEVP